MENYRNSVTERLASVYDWAWEEVRGMTDLELMEFLEFAEALEGKRVWWTVRKAVPVIQEMVHSELRIREGADRSNSPC